MAVGDRLARLARHRSPAGGEAEAAVAVVVVLVIVLVIRQLDDALGAEASRMLASLAASR